MATRKSECTIPHTASVDAIRSVTLPEPDHQRQEIVEYVEWQINKGADSDNKVVHLERIKSEVVMGTEHVAWDVHTNEPSRWWVVTGPTNLYSQEQFPSLDYTLSFHVGVMARVASRDAKKAPQTIKDRLRGTWRRWETAVESLDLAKEAEDFQAVGMRCRETLVSLAKALQKQTPPAKGTEPPKSADFLAWMSLILDHHASGSRNEHIRSFLKNSSKDTWQLVNWLTHTSRASLHEALLALDATSNLLGMMSRVVIRAEAAPPLTCPKCGSYRVASVYEPDLDLDPPYVNLCESCGWDNTSAAEA